MTRMIHINPDGKAVSGLRPKEMAVLHIYSQTHEHSEAVIIGNSLGLRLLASAILDAIRKDKAKTEEEVFATDGEGYDVVVKVLPDSWHDKAWKKYPPHYCDRGYNDDKHKQVP